MNRRLGSGLVLLVAAFVLVITVDPRGPLPIYWLPIGAGLGFLAAAVVSGRPGRMWEAGFVLTGWGIAAALTLGGIIDLSSTPAYLLGVAGGALVAALAARTGIRVTPAGIALAVLYVGLSDLWVTIGPSSLNTDPIVFAALLALRAVVELVAGGQDRRRSSELVEGDLGVG